MSHPLVHLRASRDELLQASRSIKALQDEKCGLLSEVAEAEDEARQWQHMAMVLLRRANAANAGAGPAHGSQAGCFACLEPSLVADVVDEVPEELSERMLSTRIFRQELAFSAARLQEEEVEVDQLTAALDDLRMKELSAEAAVQHREWHCATVQSTRQRIAKQAQAISTYRDAARTAELCVNRLREQVQQLHQDEVEAATAECWTKSRRVILQNESQELRSLTLALCEELASSNHEAGSKLEEKVRLSHLAQFRVQGARLRQSPERMRVDVGSAITAGISSQQEEKMAASHAEMWLARRSPGQPGSTRQPSASKP